MSMNKNIISNIPLIHLVHWWFIDRTELKFSEIEMCHINKILQYSLMYSYEIHINVCLDHDDVIYKSFITEFFEKYDKIHITFCLNDEVLCEYLTFSKIYNYNDCIVLYSHFKGISCLVNSDGKSSNSLETIDAEYRHCEYAYDSLFNECEFYDLSKIFYGFQVTDAWYSDNKLGDEGKTSHLMYANNFYAININNLKTEMRLRNIRKKYWISLNGKAFWVPIHCYGELLPSIFPVETLSYIKYYKNN